jgi:starch-binding outer membrane protein, SusD/RagB family
MKYLIIILIALVTLTTSCKKFLEEEPYSFLSSTNFYRTEGDAVAALNGVFSGMQQQTYYGRTSWLISELTGEALTTGGNTSADRATLDKYTYTGSNGEILNWWRNIYALVNKANDAIVNVPNIPMDTVKRNHILGNLKFLRGLAYFELVRSFGSVPLVLSPTTASSETQVKKASLEVLYQQIIDDLKFAEANCLAENKISASLKGQVSTGAASSILAKVYLTRAKDQSDYQLALDACNRVISSGLYRLVAYPDLFIPEKKNGPEHIFSVQFDLPPSIGNILIRMLVPSQAFPGGAGSFRATTVFGNTYIAADSVRKNNSISTKVINASGATVTVPLYFSKYKDALWTNQSNNARSNWLITRYADVLLMHSEALHRLNPTDANKFSSINAVRIRAGLTAFQLNFTNTPTSNDFINALVKERGWEFCMEGHRRWDLIRLGKLEEVLLTDGVTVTPDKVLFPIPDSEIALNPNLK